MPEVSSKPKHSDVNCAIFCNGLRCFFSVVVQKCSSYLAAACFHLVLLAVTIMSADSPRRSSRGGGTIIRPQQVRFVYFLSLVAISVF